MTKKIVSSILALAVSAVCAFAQMSDEGVLNYVMQGISAGKSQNQISTELLAKGVTVAQAKRVMQNYKSSQSGEVSSIQTTKLDVSTNPLRESSRIESMVVEKDKKTTEEEKDKKNDVVLSDETGKIVIYGHDIFKNKNLTFEPNQNTATPRDYVLGPGDEVIIDVWGVNETTIKQLISPEGRITISQVGPLDLSGLTIDQAENKIKNALARKYSLGGSNPASRLSLTLGRIRTIQVNVMGEVNVPGTYRLSSLSTVFNALYNAGGVTDIGSVRNIMLSRNGQVISTVDLYKLIFDGNNGGNMSLRDDDAIIVPTYSALVQTEGGFKRPMYYEVLPGEGIDKIIQYSGGFLANAYDREVILQHKDGVNGDVHSVNSQNYSSYSVQDGDILTAYTYQQRAVFTNMVQVKGCVARPGVYEMGVEIATVRQLVDKAGGLLDEAYRSRAQIIREKENRELEIKAVPIGAIIDGTAPDVVLRSSDILVVSNALQLEPKGDLKVIGYVRKPGNYEYAEGMTVEDLILLAGGLEDGASSAKVDVSRRIVDSESKESSDNLAEIFSFGIADGLMVDGKPDFTLQPYDIVAVRKSPTYIEQKRVRVSGEGTFPGEYTLMSNDERISDLFKRAGGATANAYIEGAMLKRKVTEDERNVRRNMVNLVKKGGNRRDSLLVDKLKINETYAIGINLEKAIAHPGCSDDLILHDGDELIIPAKTNTVRIQGEVMYPNAVNYIPGKPVSYYIEQAGGYSNEAKRSKVYVVHMNGKVSVGSGAKITAGSEVIVPSRPERQKTTVGEWIGIGTAAASITTMVATIVNLMNR